MKNITGIVNDRRGEAAIHIAALAIIAYLCLSDIMMCRYPIINSDSFGYWSNAMSLCGYDWGDLIERNSYYGWGYSLVLVPIIKLLPHAVWYQSAIVLNAVFLGMSYILAYMTGRILFPDLNKGMVILVSLMVVIFPNNIVYAQETWTESLLYMLMWCVTYLVVSMDRQFSYVRFVIMQILIGYMYIVHARCIGIVLAGAAISALLLYKHKKNMLVYILVIVLFAGMYLINSRVKGYLIDTYYNNSSASSVNNVGLDGGTIGFYISKLFNNIGLFFSSFAGKSAYLMMITGFSVCIAMAKGLKKIFRWFKYREDEHVISYIWCMIAVLVAVALCALQMIIWSYRKDVIVYARYFDYTCGPVLFIGIMYAIEGAHKTKIIEMAGRIVNIVLMGMSIYCIVNAEGVFNVFCNPSIGVLYNNAADTRTLVRSIVVIENLFACTILSDFWVDSRKLRTSITIGVFAAIYLMLGMYGKSYMVDIREQLDKRVLSMYDIVGEDDELYYYMPSESQIGFTTAQMLQYLRYDKEIQVVDIDSTQIIDDERFYAIVSEDDAEQFLKKHAAQLVFARDNVLLYSVGE